MKTPVGELAEDDSAAPATPRRTRLTFPYSRAPHPSFSGDSPPSC